MIYVVGPGHGAPAILACLWLDQSLERFYSQYTRDWNGLHRLITGFSTPGGFPSHVNAQTPGSIHEGGELGYVLSVAYGAVMDKPDLIAAVVVGDGEAETGPTATAWHANKFIDPAESGAVLPIVHINGFKISERTLYGCMDDVELTCLFSGYGYEPIFVENLQHIDQDMAHALAWAIARIRKIQSDARAGRPQNKPRWPVILLRTPKGMGGPKQAHGHPVEGSFRSHQVPLPNVKSDPEELLQLQQWLQSYNPKELFPSSTGVCTQIDDVISPLQSRRLGQQPASWDNHVALKLPEWKTFGVGKGSPASCLQNGARYLDVALQCNKNSLRIFSPDELVSNKLDAVLNHTSRNMQWDQDTMNVGGQVVEILSEHTCEGKCNQP
jgi:xylulose-5-phosphate/fructose-6-phosphate phosphoketolase